MKTKSEPHVLYSHMKSHMDLYLMSLFVGIFSGGVAVFYKIALDIAGHLRHSTFNFIKSNINITTIFFTIIGSILISMILGWIITNIPMVKGSGIPQVKGIIARQMDFQWGRELLAKFFGGVVAVFAGMSLGREGPSVQLGAEVGSGFFKVFKRKEYDKKYLISCGASAGLSAAFGAPISGTLFAIEELHKFVSPLLLTCVLIASVSAEFVSRKFFGFLPAFSIKVDSFYQLKDYLFIIVFAIVVTFIGKLFSKGILNFQKIYNNIKIKPIIKPIIVVALALVIGIFCFEVTGGGHHLAQDIIDKTFPYKTLLIFLVLKFLFTLICYATGAPGGIFLPILVIGAILGKIYGMLVIDTFNLANHYEIYYVIIGMATLLTAVTKVPLTSTVLILEMTGSFHQFLPVVTACMTTFLISELLGIKPIYDLLLSNMLRKKKKNTGHESKKIIVKIPVAPDSVFDNFSLKEIKWPGKCLVVDIERGEEHITPDKYTIIHGGDLLIILMDEYTANDITHHLIEMGEKIHLSDVALNNVI